MMCTDGKNRRETEALDCIVCIMTVHFPNHSSYPLSFRDKTEELLELSEEKKREIQQKENIRSVTSQFNENYLPPNI